MKIPTATPTGVFAYRVKTMTKKFLSFALAACVSVGVGIALFGIDNDLGTDTAPSHTRPQSLATSEPALKREQRTDPQTK